MTDPNRHFGPRVDPATERSDPAVEERESVRSAPGIGDSEERLSYDKRAAAAVEAVRQMEAYLSGRSAGPGTRRPGPAKN